MNFAQAEEEEEEEKEEEEEQEEEEEEKEEEEEDTPEAVAYCNSALSLTQRLGRRGRLQAPCTPQLVRELVGI
eukprot:1330416-Pyramimonas_sp.AAC.1